MQRFIAFLFILFISLSACQEKTEKKLKAASTGNDPEAAKPEFVKDLDAIKEDGKLKVLIAYSATSYFLYRGHPMGYEYELLERLAKSLDLELELHVADDLNNLFDELNNGTVDLVAHGLTITSERKKFVAFSDYLYLTRQVLVQKKPDNWRKLKWQKVEKALIDDPIELIGDTISVRKNSSYFNRLVNLSRELGDDIYIDTLPGDLSTDEIIKKVVDGEIKYTVADDNIARINASYYPVLNIEVPVSFSQRIAWAVRTNSPKLLGAINTWIEKERKGLDFYVIYNKYFKNEKNFRRRVKSEFYSLNKNKISKFDGIIKTHAKKIGWDWRLLASQIYQESRFKPKTESWAGAKGLMQMMPATMASLGIKNIHDPQESIRGGVAYLKKLQKSFTSIPDSVQRIKFALASYNCGLYHVIDAQNLAKLRGLDPKKWDDNVEKMILELSYPKNYNLDVVKYGYVRGIEPYTYVEQIFERYEHYRNFIESDGQVIVSR